MGLDPGAPEIGRVRWQMASPQEDKYTKRFGTDESVRGRYAECDGGGTLPTVLPNGQWGIMPGRQLFKGVLTGLYFDQGDPPWRWYEMLITRERPSDYPEEEETVWCEPGFLFVSGDEEGAWKRRMP